MKEINSSKNRQILCSKTQVTCSWRTRRSDVWQRWHRSMILPPGVFLKSFCSFVGVISRWLVLVFLRHFWPSSWLFWSFPSSSSAPSSTSSTSAKDWSNATSPDRAKREKTRTKTNCICNYLWYMNMNLALMNIHMRQLQLITIYLSSFDLRANWTYGHLILAQLVFLTFVLFYNCFYISFLATSIRIPSDLRSELWGCPRPKIVKTSFYWFYFCMHFKRVYHPIRPPRKLNAKFLTKSCFI